jgi:hypothetical protein
MTVGTFCGVWNAPKVNSIFFKRGELIRSHAVWKSVGLEFPGTPKMGKSLKGMEPMSGVEPLTY